MRREEYETSNGNVVVYLETPEGRFLLLPSARLMAELKDVTTPALPTAPQPDEDVDLSVNRLLNEGPVETRYDSLGSEAGQWAQRRKISCGSRTS